MMMVMMMMIIIIIIIINMNFDRKWGSITGH